jgi:putative Ig domain-containing protein
LAAGVVNTVYSTTLEARGGVPPYSWTTPENLPAGLSLSIAGAITGAPTATGAFNVAVQVTDSRGASSSKTFVLTIDKNATFPPQFSIVGLPTASTPAQQFNVGVELDRPSPTLVAGRLDLSFVPDAINPSDDPAVQFSTGGRSVEFTVSPQATSAKFAAPQVAVSTGTVAGVIRVTLNMPDASGSAIVREIRLDRLPPQIVAVKINPTDAGFEVRITGYSTSRDMLRALFTFNASADGNLRTSEIAVDLNDAFTGWYRNATSSAFGSAFEYVQPFTVQGDRRIVQSVTVTLTNTQGSASSGAVNTNFQ